MPASADVAAVELWATRLRCPQIHQPSRLTDNSSSGDPGTHSFRRRTYLSELLDEFTIFYIQRDGRDVMTSFWAYFHKIRPGWGPKTATVGEFMRATSIGPSTQFQATRRRITMLWRWAEHVRGWNANRQGLPVNYLTYEALHERHEQLIDRLADILGQTPVSRDRPSLQSNSVLPWRGEIGTWKEFFTEADIAYFERHTKGLLDRPAPPIQQRSFLRWVGLR